MPGCSPPPAPPEGGEAARYLLEDADLAPEEARRLYRTVVGWAADRAEEFVLALDESVYDDPAAPAALRALGTVSLIPPPPGDRLRGLLERFLGRQPAVVQVRGRVGEDLVREVTSRPAPPRAAAGRLCPAEDLLLLLEGRPLYGCHDYGRMQLVDVTEPELDDLRRALGEAGFRPDLLAVAPGSS